MPLELQRRIVNEAIGQRVFAALLWLCGAYALTALVQGLAKLAWNVYRNSVGEATSRRLRLETFAAALRLARRRIRRFNLSRSTSTSSLSARVQPASPQRAACPRPAGAIV